MDKPDTTLIESAVSPGNVELQTPVNRNIPLRLVDGFKAFFSDNTLTKKASLNAIAAGLDYTASLLVGFLITPLLVSGLGDFYYGVYQFLNRLINYLTPASGRPTQALKMTLANQNLVASDEEKRTYVGSTLVIWFLFLPITAILGALLTWFVPFWLKAPAESFFIIRLVSAILVFDLIISNLSALPQSALEGQNLAYKRIGLSAFLEFIGGGLTWMALSLHTGLIGVSISILLTSIISGVFFLQVVRTFSPWFGAKKPTLHESTDFLKLSAWFMIWNMVNIAMMASDVVVLGIFQSVQAVTSYTLTKYAPETSISIIAIAVFGILPGLGGIIGTRDFKKAASVRREIMTFSWWVLTVFGSMILIWNQAFIKLWVGKEHYSGTIVNLLVILMVTQFVVLRNDANVIDLTLKIQRKSLIGLISVFISILLAILFVSPLKLGIVGLCLGIMAGRLVLSVAYPLIIGKMLNITPASQLRGIIRPALITLLLFPISCLLGEKAQTWKSFFTTNWFGLAAIVLATVVILVMFTYLVGFNSTQKKNVLRRIKAVFPGAIKPSNV